MVWFHVVVVCMHVYGVVSRSCCVDACRWCGFMYLLCESMLQTYISCGKCGFTSTLFYRDGFSGNTFKFKTLNYNSNNNNLITFDMKSYNLVKLVCCER